MLESEDCIDAFVFMPTFIDFDIFRSWNLGLSETEVAHQFQNISQFHLTKGQLEAEVRSNFTQFMLLESEFQSPDIFVSSKFGGAFQFDVNTKLTLVQMYYDLDLHVLRELLGRKLNRKDKKELEDISESTGISIISCQRQFDNIRRVAKYCEDICGNVKLSDAISAKFHLNNDLIKKYVAAVFLNYHRFETNKKKQAQLKFPDFQKCVDDIMINWTYSNKENLVNLDLDSYHPADLDYHFLQELRSELKSLSDKEHVEEIKKMVDIKWKEIAADSDILNIDTIFKPVYKAVLNIGLNLNHSKAVKDLFIDIIDKIIEPCKTTGLNLKEVDYFQDVFCQSFLEYNSIKRVHIMRFLQTLFNCVLIFYPRISFVNNTD